MKTFGLLSATALVFLFYGFSANTASEDPAGKKMFADSKCNSCHSIDSEGVTSKAKKKNDLSEIGSKYDSEFLAKYISKKEAVNEKKHSVAFKGTDDELKQLSDWLASLKKETK